MKKVFGFTIIELLISIGIFLVITSMVIVNFRSGQYRDELMGSAQILQSTLREMQALSFSGSKVACPGYAEEMTPAGYGLNISSETITAFADCDPSDPDISPNYIYGGTSEDVNLKTINLYNNISIESITVGTNAVSTLDAVFTPFSEIVKINSSETDNIIIELIHSKTSKTVTVKIMQSTGQIFIQ
jgi:type II secretory pathway pseudopilin PulG